MKAKEKPVSPNNTIIVWFIESMSHQPRPFQENNTVLFKAVMLSQYHCDINLLLSACFMSSGPPQWKKNQYLSTSANRFLGNHQEYTSTSVC